MTDHKLEQGPFLASSQPNFSVDSNS
jgi:hypothetical protein